MSTDDTPTCDDCGSDIIPVTLATTGVLCSNCRDAIASKARARWCVVPLHKSSYMLVTDRSLLTGINNKGGLVR